MTSRERGLAALRTGEAAAAVQLLQAAVQESGDDGHSWMGLGVALCQGGRPEEGVRALERADALLPGRAPVQFNLGRALEQLGKRDAAIAAYGKAASLDPNHAQAAAAVQRLGGSAAAPPSAASPTPPAALRTSAPPAAGPPLQPPAPHSPSVSAPAPRPIAHVSDFLLDSVPTAPAPRPAAAPAASASTAPGAAAATPPAFSPPTSAPLPPFPGIPGSSPLPLWGTPASSGGPAIGAGGLPAAPLQVPRANSVHSKESTSGGNTGLWVALGVALLAIVGVVGIVAMAVILPAFQRARTLAAARSGGGSLPGATSPVPLGSSGGSGGLGLFGLGGPDLNSTAAGPFVNDSQNGFTLQFPNGFPQASAMPHFSPIGFAGMGRTATYDSVTAKGDCFLACFVVPPEVFDTLDTADVFGKLRSKLPPSLHFTLTATQALQVQGFPAEESRFTSTNYHGTGHGRMRFVMAKPRILIYGFDGPGAGDPDSPAIRGFLESLTINDQVSTLGLHAPVDISPPQVQMPRSVPMPQIPSHSFPTPPEMPGSRFTPPSLPTPRTPTLPTPPSFPSPQFPQRQFGPRSGPGFTPPDFPPRSRFEPPGFGNPNNGTPNGPTPGAAPPAAPSST